MTHDGGELDKHLERLHAHGLKRREEAQAASLRAHEELEAERARTPASSAASEQ